MISEGKASSPYIFTDSSRGMPKETPTRTSLARSWPWSLRWAPHDTGNRNGLPWISRSSEQESSWTINEH